MTKLSKNILDKIKKDKIKPIPRWQFISLHILLWTAYLLAIAFGALAFSVIFRLIGGVQWEMVRLAGKGPVQGFVLVLPYLWLIILGVVLFLAGKLFEKTKGGYRFKHVVVVLSSVAISLILGMMFYFVGVGHSVENSLTEKVGPYAEWRDMRDKFLVAPDNGVLVGRVLDIKPKEELMIIDFMRTKWVVDISEAFSVDNFQPQIGRPVGLAGEKISDDEFKADKIFPFRPQKPRKILDPLKK